MNGMKVFDNPEFGSIRTDEENGKVLFCGNDVAKALGYKSPKDAVSAHCKGAVKRRGVSETTNQYGTTTKQEVEMNYIPEGDVYRLITHSKLPSAERFESWVFDEVIPSIRQTGQYGASQKSPTLADVSGQVEFLSGLWKRAGASDYDIAFMAAELYRYHGYLNDSFYPVPQMGIKPNPELTISDVAYLAGLSTQNGKPHAEVAALVLHGFHKALRLLGYEKDGRYDKNVVQLLLCELRRLKYPDKFGRYHPVYLLKRASREKEEK